MKYGIIYADPPWQYERPSTLSLQLQGYCQMSAEELKRMNVESLAEDNALLFMWTSGPVMQQSIELMESWGFSYRTVAFVWNKKNPTFGKYTMPMCEYILVGKRGSIPKPRGLRNIRQHLSLKKGEHSVKPDIFRTLITKMFPIQRKLEMFAREAVEGWDVFGNEATNSISIPMRSKFEMRQLERRKLCRIH